MNDSTRPPATATTTNFTLRAGAEQSFAAWQSKFTNAATQATGFLTLDIVPTFAGSPDWQITQRFRSPEALDLGWSSSVRAQMLAELAPMRHPGGGGSEDETLHSFDPLSCVTEVIMTRAMPSAFRWCRGLTHIAIFYMGWWLRPAPTRRWRREALGIGTMLALYIIELAIFMLVF
jgi:hypothetical protein